MALIDVAYEPYLSVSKANGIRFIPVADPNCCDPKTPDNTFYYEYNQKKKIHCEKYYQQVSHCDISHIGFQSSFLENKITILRDGQVIETFNARNIASFPSTPSYTMPADATLLAPSPNNLSIYLPTTGVPQLASFLGTDVIITDFANGKYQNIYAKMVSRSFYQYNFTTKQQNIPFGGGTNAGISVERPLANFGKFFDFKINWKGYGTGTYQIKIEGTMVASTAPDYTRIDSLTKVVRKAVYISEPIKMVSPAETIVIKYTNKDNGYGLLYDTTGGNPDPITHFIRVKGFFGLEDDFETEQEIYRRADGVNVKLYESISKKLKVQLQRIPNYLHEKIRIALSHDTVSINGKSITADKYDKGKSKSSLSPAEFFVLDNDFFEENEP